MSKKGPATRASYSEGAAFGALGFAVMTALAFVSSVVIARMYGVRALGQFALVMAPVNAVWYLSSARERPAFVRELATLAPRAPRVTSLFYAMLSFSVALTVLVAGIGLVVADVVYRGPVDQPDLFMPALASLVGYVVLTNTGWNLDALLSGFRAGRELFWIRLGQALAFLGFAVAGGIVLDTVWGLVWATVASSGTSLAHRLILSHRYARAVVSRAELRRGFGQLPELIRFGLKLVPGSVANGVSNESGTWILGVVSSVSAVGAYDRAWNLGRRFVELNWRVTEMLFPTLVERRSTGDRSGFDRAFVDTLRYCAAGMLLPAAAGGGASVAVMQLFGPGFAEAADALAILLLMPALTAMAFVQRTALVALDRPWLTSITAVVRMVVTLAGAIVLTPVLGIAGTATGLVLGAASYALWMAVLIRPSLTERFTSLWTVREMVALAIAVGGGFITARAVDSAIDGLAALIPALVAGTVVYAGLFLALGGFNARDRDRLGRLIWRLRNRGGAIAPEPVHPQR